MWIGRGEKDGRGGEYMEVSQEVSTALPSLRRYARALTGSQESGDAYVVAAIETLIKQPDLLEGAGDVRVELFRIFSKIWNSVAANQGADQGDALPIERRLSQIAAMPRQAFLLVSLEAFTEEQGSYILDIDIGELRRLIELCGREVADQIATNVLIIEDESLIAFDLQSLVESLGHTVQGVARTRAEAISLAKKNKPGLVLADIKLADGSSGLDAVNDILRSFEVPVIFITAYPERFLTGTRPEPAFLITKPYQPATVSAVLSQALFFEQKAKRKVDHAPG
jgi:CheY-like chemotaxis protein/DNA-directed RNA polymerase specialized sigma24 family protein